MGHVACRAGLDGHSLGLFVGGVHECGELCWWVSEMSCWGLGPAHSAIAGFGMGVHNGLVLHVLQFLDGHKLGIVLLVGAFVFCLCMVNLCWSLLAGVVGFESCVLCCRISGEMR